MTSHESSDPREMRNISREVAPDPLRIATPHPGPAKCTRVRTPPECAPQFVTRVPGQTTSFSRWVLQGRVATLKEVLICVCVSVIKLANGFPRAPPLLY